MERATQPAPERPAALPHAELVREIRRRLAARQRRTIAIEGYRPAAVALLLREHEGATWVPFIVRPGAMRAHAGQIALPGGTRDECDDSFAACARRETHEELGVAPEQVDVLGMLDDVPTPTGFVITPVVAELRGDGTYRPSPDEVSAVFEAPLAAFADPALAEDMGEREHWGMRYRVRAYPFGEHRIWGATARVLEELHDLLRDHPP
ncbi:MAG TPA: CoA pyrophosphatase [Kofleriaceae bacterium]|nr:CoA pyrophosphatase [Kofleriaceae bacterium]